MRVKVTSTRKIPNPNIYVKMLPEYKGWIFVEDEAETLRSKWTCVFGDPLLPLDLEIGCGNGFFFEQQATGHLDRNLLGIELKYKPLVQTVRRVKKRTLSNARGIRYNAHFIDDIFAPDELHNVFIFFPDPWPKARQKKNRLLKAEFFKKIYQLQKNGTFLDFKTDSQEYFDFAREELKASPYILTRYTRDLHASEWATENFVTAFERIFISKGLPIYYLRLEKKV